RDDKVRGGELVFGFAPIDDLEVGLGLARATDHDLDPSTKLRGTGIGYPWVPIQNDSGWSLGVRSDMSRMRADERFAFDTITEGEYAFFDLVTFRFESGQVLHLNLGAKRTKAGDESESVGTWGVGYKHPLAKKRNLTAEIFGEAYAGPDKAVGLRYEIAEGFKIWGAVGCGNDRSFA
ncbi:MAG: hypothetical protein P3W97_003065, partial [Tepidimonas sp.]|uniref:hypothetical protein n=1 Tax=Tepidimonas sp. TaxID=2002775 RepID=UPI00259E07C0